MAEPKPTVEITQRGAFLAWPDGRFEPIEVDSPLFKRLPAPVQGKVRRHIQRLQRSGVLQEHQRRTTTPVQRVLGTAGQMGQQAAIPTGFSAVGGVVSPFFGIASPVGSGIGGMTGEFINQQLGITDPNLMQIIMAGATGGAVRGAGRLGVIPQVGPRVNLRPIARILPGSPGAFTEVAQEQLEGAVRGIERGTAIMLGDDTINDLFTFATGTAAGQQGRIRIPVTNTRQALQQQLAVQGRAKKLGVGFQGLGTRMQTMARAIKRGQGRLELRDLDELRQSIGARIGRLSIDDRQRGILRTLYKGIMDDIDAGIQTGQPGAEALRQAVKASRREFAARDLGDFLEQRIFGNPRADGLRPIAIGKLKREIDAIKAGRPSRVFELFEGSLEPGELDEISRLVDFWSENLDPLPPPQGVQHGAGPTVTAGGAGLVLGGTTGFGVGVVGKQLLTMGLMSRSGRAALRNLIARRQPINLAELGLIMAGTVGRQQLSPQAIGQQLMERFAPPRLERAR